MNKKTKFLISILLIAQSFISFSALANVEIWYPDNGRVIYNGSRDITIEMQWKDGASFQFWADQANGLGPAGFEMDAVIRKEFFAFCISHSTFADKYDDCPTAGVVEGSNQWSFGCGTYSGIQFALDPVGGQTHEHTCRLQFPPLYPEYKNTTDLGINAQIVTRNYCQSNQLWCYNSTATERLNRSIHNSNKFYITRGQSFVGTWGNYTGFPAPSPFSSQSLDAVAIPKSTSTNDLTVPLTIGAVNRGAYGKNYGTNQNPITARAQFIINTNNINSKNYYFNVNGYDIDSSDEVSIRINGHSYGHLRTGQNNTLNVGDFISINNNHLVLGKNTITFTQKSNGEKWGVTNLHLSRSSTPPPPVIGIALGQQINTGYGNNYGTNQHKNQLITTFSNPDKHILLKVQGYNITGATQTSVYINDEFLGYLSVGSQNALNAGDEFEIDRDQLITGQNSIVFVTPGNKTWGVKNISLEEAPSNIIPFLQLLLLDDEPLLPDE